jgi:hypothetical protein
MTLSSLQIRFVKFGYQDLRKIAQNLCQHSN